MGGHYGFSAGSGAHCGSSSSGQPELRSVASGAQIMALGTQLEPPTHRLLVDNSF